MPNVPPFWCLIFVFAFWCFEVLRLKRVRIGFCRLVRKVYSVVCGSVVSGTDRQPDRHSERCLVKWVPWTAGASETTRKATLTSLRTRTRIPSCRGPLTL
jgi:hypothetical protein